MDSVFFTRRLAELREGKAFLRPDSHELRDHAMEHMGDLKKYVAALEAGYRALRGRLEAYRGQARGKTLGQMVRNQWSEGACLGYAVMGLRGANFKPDEAVRVLEAMEEAMEVCGLDEAAQAHQDLIEGRRSEAPE